MQPLQARVDLGVMAMKSYSAFPKAPALLELYHLIVKCHIQGTCCEGFIHLPRCSWCILQPQPIGLRKLNWKNMHEIWSLDLMRKQVKSLAIFWYALVWGTHIIWAKQFKSWKVATVVNSIMGVDMRTIC